MNGSALISVRELIASSHGQTILSIISHLRSSSSTMMENLLFLWYLGTPRSPAPCPSSTFAQLEVNSLLKMCEQLALRAKRMKISNFNFKKKDFFSFFLLKIHILESVRHPFHCKILSPPLSPGSLCSRSAQGESVDRDRSQSWPSGNPSTRRITFNKIKVMTFQFLRSCYLTIILWSKNSSCLSFSCFQWSFSESAGPDYREQWPERFNFLH